MKKYLTITMLSSAIIFASSCQSTKKEGDDPEGSSKTKVDTFTYHTEQFADIKVLRYQVPGFEELTKKQRIMLYYLYQAALSGRDIFWDQNCKHNLLVRKTLENIVTSYKGDKNTPDYDKWMTYTKRVWFSNGIHHHYQNTKILPEVTAAYFAEVVKNSDVSKFPVQNGENIDAFIKRITPIIFDPNVAPKKVSKDPKSDLIQSSAVNFYEGVTQKEVEGFYGKLRNSKDSMPLSYGLNSKLVKENGVLTEKTWKVGGMYSAAIEKIVYWLELAITVAENEEQKLALEKLVAFYKTGDLKTFDEYNIAWVKDINSVIDVVNGFIEVYEDPMGMRGSYESVVSIKDMEASKRISTIGANAQWFEDNSSIMKDHKKAKVQGISAKVITVVVEAGDASPSTPIGINLPNSNWIRTKHGSKSVQLGNIVYAYGASSKGSGFLEEFAYSPEDIQRQKKFGDYADILHTDMHEVIGHASGKINKGVGEPEETLKNYSSTLEEARADLVALYYLTDQKLIEIGVMDNIEYGKASYDDYIRNGMMTQLTRLKLGEDIEEDHMRNRQMVAQWVFEKGKAENVIEKKIRDGKTFFVVNDYAKLRTLFGELLKEVQRVKSEGDYKAGKNLVETYGVKVDPALHKEVLARYEKLKIAPYSGFINPKVVPFMNSEGKIVDAKLEYPFGFTEQMLEYSRDYSFLPVNH